MNQGRIALSLQYLLAALLLTVAALQAQARPPAPPPPAKYQATVHYRINAPRDQHVAQYDALIDHLEKLGFEFTPALEDLPPTDREDPGKTLLTGVVSSGKALKVLDHRSVASVLLAPSEYKLPEQGDQPVKVQLELASGFGPESQIALVDQVRLLLHELGFRETAGYDHHGYTGRSHTRLRGVVPAGQLEMLLKDLRRQPTGWFAPKFGAADLPVPLRSVAPILVVEVLPDPGPFTEPETPADRGDENLDKINADLWSLANQKEQSGPVRMEVILATLPDEGEDGWQQSLRAAVPGFLIEGRLGQIVTGVAAPAEARSLASLPLVAAVRLPRPARVQVDPVVKFKTDTSQVLKRTGLESLHPLGVRGKGVRVAVVDADFRGYEALIASKKLPAGTRLVDLTVARTPTLQPDPLPGDADTVGHGTHCALAVALAAPEVDLTLVRIDPAAPYMLQEVADYIKGDGFLSVSLRRRLEEQAAAAAALRLRRNEVLQERKIVLEVFEDDAESQQRYAFFGPIRAWVFSPREWHRLRLAELERDEQAQREQETRLLQLLRGIRGLQGIQIVSTSLVWNDGYALGGRSALSRFFDTLPSEKAPSPLIPATRGHKPEAAWPPLWFVSAGNTRGQSWNGLFRDADGNGVLEFAVPEARLPSGSWSSELNFLAWQPFGASETAELPAKAKVRVSVQWTEPHDPDYYFRPGEADLYRNPLARLTLVVLRQRDPSTKVLPADDFEVVARSWGRPQRLDNSPTSATYEAAVEFTVEQEGRYALRVERQLPTAWLLDKNAGLDTYALRMLTDLVPTGIRPLGVATLPALEKRWELTPRLLVQALDDASAGLGRVVFHDFATDLGSVGVPADARKVIAVGAADLDGKAEPYSAAGPPANQELFVTPRLLAYDALDLGITGRGTAYGTSLAAPLAAGSAAILHNAGWSRRQILETLRGQERHLLHVPAR